MFEKLVDIVTGRSRRRSRIVNILLSHFLRGVRMDENRQFSAEWTLMFVPMAALCLDMMSVSGSRNTDHLMLEAKAIRDAIRRLDEQLIVRAARALAIHILATGKQDEVLALIWNVWTTREPGEVEELYRRLGLDAYDLVEVDRLENTLEGDSYNYFRTSYQIFLDRTIDKADTAIEVLSVASYTESVSEMFIQFKSRFISVVQSHHELDEEMTRELLKRVPS